jgi:phage terminase large subunit
MENTKTIKFKWSNPKFKQLFLPYDYKFAYGGRSGGKSTDFIQGLLRYAMRSRIRILCCREIQNSIKDSVHRLIADVINKYKLNDIFKVRRDSITCVNGTDFFFKGFHSNIDAIKSTEGINICFVDEAQSLSNESWEILTPTVRKDGSEIWGAFNRFHADDPVWERFCTVEDPNVLLINVNYYDNRLLSDKSRREAEKCKRKNPEEYKHVWLGEPRKSGDNYILYDWQIQQNYLLEKIEVKEPLNSAGVDVARMGSDKSVITVVKNNIVQPQVKINGFDTVQLVDKIEMVIPDKNFDIKIDAGNTGAAVVDILARRGYTAIHEIHFGSNPSDKEKYDNAITEMWFNLVEKLESVKLPKCEILKKQLVNRKYSYKLKNIKSKMREVKTIQSKDKYKAETKSGSPDEADSLVLALYDCKPKSVFRIRKI